MRVAAHYAAWLVGLAAAQTQTTGAERDCLASHARGRSRLAEIGVWHGVTTARLRRVMAEDGELTAVDPFLPGRLGINLQERIAHCEVARVLRGRVRWLKMTGAEAAREHPPVEFVFIDGDHSEAGLLADWAGWSRLVTPGGVAALHDSRSTPARPLDAGSVRVTDDVIRRDPRFACVDEVDSLTVWQKR